MYLRVTTVHRGSKTYHYTQIVEGYRREDGTPTNRVIASLGTRTDAEIAALRVALKIASKGGTPVLPCDGMAQVHVLASLRYLDAAVLRRAFHQLVLRRLLRDALAKDGTKVPTVDVIEALVLQRCLAPGSKLAASRWYPTTALPELQGVAPEQFNNSRVHRALDALEAAEGKLQDLLPARLFADHGAAAALFLDATDTWFEGHGPPLAAKGKDKHGVYRRRVGIVLLCDHRGYPLRWHTLDGRYHDPTALGEMAAEVAALPWVQTVPLAVDRALGSAGWVSQLHELGIRYLTCVPAPELEGCGAPIPWPLLAALQHLGEDLAGMRSKVLGADFVHAGQDRYVLELGLFNKSRPRNAKRLSQAQLALGMLLELEGSQESNATLAQRLHLSTRNLPHYRRLTTLGPQVRQRIENGDANALSLEQLQLVAAVPAGQQVALFETLVAAAPVRYRQAQRRRLEQPAPLPAQGALSLNLERLRDDRRADEERLAKIRARVEDVNRRLANPQSQRKDASALAEVDELIRKLALGDVCSTSMEKTAAGRQVLLQVNDDAWHRRRRSDGLALVVCHPDVPGTALERVTQYFRKDAIEKDFQSIKSVLGLRPVRHQTDEKLRAHVTVCVLALLLTRLIEHALAAADEKRSLREVVETLEPARLNLIDDGNHHYYTAAQPSEEALALLRALHMEQLADNAEIAREVTPRQTDAPKTRRTRRAKRNATAVTPPDDL